MRRFQDPSVKDAANMATCQLMSTRLNRHAQPLPKGYELLFRRRLRFHSIMPSERINISCSAPASFGFGFSLSSFLSIFRSALINKGRCSCRMRVDIWKTCREKCVFSAIKRKFAYVCNMNIFTEVFYGKNNFWPARELYVTNCYGKCMYYFFQYKVQLCQTF